MTPEEPRNSEEPEELLSVRRVFDVDADVDAIAAHLGKDPMLAPLLKKHPGLRVPGAWWKRKLIGEYAPPIARPSLSSSGSSVPRVPR